MITDNKIKPCDIHYLSFERGGGNGVAYLRYALLCVLLPLFISCGTGTSSRHDFPDTLRLPNRAEVDRRECFFYYGDSITREQDDKQLISPIIELPKNNKWNAYRLRQLDSMCMLAKKYPTYQFTVDVMNLNTELKGYSWGTEDIVAHFIDMYCLKKDLSPENIGAATDFSLMGLIICVDIDSLLKHQNEDSIYYLMLSKRKN